MQKIICLCLYLFFLCNPAFVAQNTDHLSADSLSRRARIVYQSNPTLAFDYSKKAIQKAIQANSDISLGKAYEMLGVSFDYLGNMDSAIIYEDKSIELLKSQTDQIPLGKVYVSKANTLFITNKNKDALSYYLKALEIMKKGENKKDEAACLMGIGNVYSAMKFNDLSLKYYEQSLAITESMNELMLTSYLLTNISEVYATLGKVDKEIEYERKSIAIKEQLNDEHGLVYSYANMANLMIRFDKKDSALYYSNRAIYLSEKLNNPDFLASSYRAQGKVYAAFNEFDKAIDYYLKGLALAHKLKSPKMEHSFLKYLAQAYTKTGKYKEAAEALQNFIAVNDSINSAEVKKSFNELQTQYETDKKEKEISLLNERDKKRSYVIYSTLVVLVLLGLLSIVLYNRFRLKHKTAQELEVRNAEIHKQKSLVDEKQKEILDSINYAKRIQFAILAHDELLNVNLPRHFVLFKPKDIVSGDFYWATKKENRFYFAVCDSTGHGVPGAFMSLLNISFLNEAINEQQIIEPNKILDFVRQRLGQHMDVGQDGMDATLLCIDNTAGSIKLTYAAANNAPVMISNGQLKELSKDKMPVGKGEKTEAFKLYEVDVNAGDTMYLYTDGFADQFGGPEGKKFKYRKLNELLVNIHTQLPAQQKQTLDDTLQNWKGNLEQVDDVCVVGIKF